MRWRTVTNAPSSQMMPVSSSAIHVSSSVCTDVTLTWAFSPANTRSTTPTTPLPAAGESSDTVRSNVAPAGATTSMAATLAAPSTPAMRTVAWPRLPAAGANTVAALLPAASASHAVACSPMPHSNASATLFAISWRTALCS